MVLSYYEMINQKGLSLQIFGFCLNTFHIDASKNDAQYPHILYCICCIHLDVHALDDDLNGITRKKVKAITQLK